MDINGNKIMCELCPANCENEKQLKDHKHKCHDQCLCPNCGKIVNGSNNLVDHINDTHKKEKCKYCTKEMILKSDIGPIKRKRSNHLHTIFNGLNKGFKIPKES